MTSPTETTSGIRYVFGVIGRWWALIVIGAVFALAIAGATLATTKDQFVARTETLVAQPDINETALPRESANKISDLLPSYLRLVTRDGAIRSAIRAANLTDSVTDLRNDIKVNQLPFTLVVSVEVTRENAEEARTIAKSLQTSFADSLDNLAGSGVKNLQPPKAIELRDATVTEQPATVLRTLIIALIIGLLVSIVVAFALDRS